MLNLPIYSRCGWCADQTLITVSLEQWFKDQQHQHLLEFFRNDNFRSSTPDLQNQKLKEYSPAMCVLTNPPGDSKACSGLRIAGLMQHRNTSLEHWFSTSAAHSNNLGKSLKILLPEKMIYSVWG